MTRISLKDLGLSALAHGLLFGMALAWIAWNRAHAPRSIDIDLTGSSMILRPKDAAPAAGTPPAPPEPWVLAAPGQRAPAPRPVAAPAPVPAEASAPCPPPCPAHPADWMPAAAASRRPEWSVGMITEDDYPAALRLKGVEGKVVADVLIDAQGRVQGVELAQAAAPEFNALVLERLKRSRFRPAYDQTGDPVACRLRLPLAFKIQ